MLSTDIEVKAQVADSSNGYCRAGCVNGYTASVRVSDRDDIVHVRIPGQQLSSDPANRIVHGWRYALDGCGNPKHVARSHRTVGIAKALERVTLKRRKWIRSRSREQELIQRRGCWRIQHLRTNPLSGLDRPRGVADHFAVPQNGL